MSNFFDDYLKLNPIENEPAKEQEKAKPMEDEPDSGGDEDNDE